MNDSYFKECLKIDGNEKYQKANRANAANALKIADYCEKFDKKRAKLIRAYAKAVIEYMDYVESIRRMQ